MTHLFDINNNFDSSKKLLINNIITILKDEDCCCMVGSFCEFCYTNMPLSECKDIDICVDKNKYMYLLNKLLHHQFKIIDAKNNIHYIKIYNTDRKIRNLHINFFDKNSIYTPISYSLCVFGISIDLFLVYNYKDIFRYINKINKINIIPKNVRKNDLKTFIKSDKLCSSTKEKHSKRLALYQNLPINAFNNFENKINKIDDYILPANFCPKIYTKKHDDLKYFSPDAAIDHYITFGRFEDRSY